MYISYQFAGPIYDTSGGRGSPAVFKYPKHPQQGKASFFVQHIVGGVMRFSGAANHFLGSIFTVKSVFLLVRI